MSWAEFLTLAPGSDRIPVELFQILKDDAVESAALNMQYAGSRHSKATYEGCLLAMLAALTEGGKVYLSLLKIDLRDLHLQVWHRYAS